MSLVDGLTKKVNLIQGLPGTDKLFMGHLENMRPIEYASAVRFEL
jgi:hypothetical protein